MASLAGTETGEVRPLLSYITSGAASYLDWIMPAAPVIAHPKMYGTVSCASSYADDAEGDHFLFDISITPETSLLRADETADAAETEKQLIEVEETPETNADRFPCFPFLLRYLKIFPAASHGATPSRALPIRRGKLIATAAVKLRETLEASESDEPPYASEILALDLPSLPETEEGEENEETEGMKETLPADYAEPPSFLLRRKNQALQGLPFGTLMHKAMEMIDFKTVPATREALRNEIMRLTESGIFTKDEEEVLPFRKKVHKSCRFSHHLRRKPSGHSHERSRDSQEGNAFLDPPSCGFLLSRLRKGREDIPAGDHGLPP